MTLVRSLDWADLIFWLSGAAAGCSILIVYVWFDRIEAWNDLLRGVAALIWLIISVAIFRLAVLTKIEATPLKKLSERSPSLKILI